VQLGILLQETGRLPEARAAYEQALKLDPNQTEPKEFLNNLAQNKN
jgi:Flp pilus assembly protein TadD